MIYCNFRRCYPLFVFLVLKKKLLKFLRPKLISIAISKKFHKLHDKNKYFGKFRFYEIVKVVYKVMMREFKQVLVAGIDSKSKRIKVMITAYPSIISSNLVYFFCNYIYANENEPCGQQELVSCSKQLKALTETSEFNFIINKEELERLCP